jgi:hypothetical protein
MFTFLSSDLQQKEIKAKRGRCLTFEERLPALSNYIVDIIQLELMRFGTGYTEHNEDETFLLQSFQRCGIEGKKRIVECILEDTDNLIKMHFYSILRAVFRENPVEEEE